MSKFDEYCEKFIQQDRVGDISENHIVFFIMFFVETYCMEFCKRKVIHKVSRPPLPLKNMLELVLLAEISKETSAKKIAGFTKSESHYQLIMDGIPVSKESYLRYKNYFIPYLEDIR